MTERDVAALAAVPGATLFKYLNVGTRFVFDPTHATISACVLVKTERGYRHEVGGKQWKTGARVACYPLPSPTELSDMKRTLPEPETRVGNCCGCNSLALLFKMQGIYRYRCSQCYQTETGQRHHLDDSPRTSVIVIP